jgi:hypothetical protein
MTTVTAAFYESSFYRRADICAYEDVTSVTLLQRAALILAP